MSRRKRCAFRDEVGKAVKVKMLHVYVIMSSPVAGFISRTIISLEVTLVSKNVRVL